MGEIGRDGDYRLTTFAPGDGALLGSFCVTIEAKEIVPSKTPSPEGYPPVSQIKWLVPQRYSRQDTSPLTAEVKSGKNTIDFDLPAEKSY